MKLLLSIIVGLVIGYLIFFQLDPFIVRSIVDMISAPSEWVGVTKFIAWVVVLVFTGGLGIWISVVFVGFVWSILDVF